MRGRLILALVAGGVGLAIGVAAVTGALPGASAGGALPAPRFVDEAAATGVDHRYDGDFQYFVGGGVAVLDCDDDGLPDLYFAGGENPATLYRNESSPGGPLAFSRVPDPVTDLEAVTGAYPLDVDGDGIEDLAVLRVGEDRLLRGLGACRFETANDAWGFDGGDAWTTAFSATWEAGSERPTLAFGSYLDPEDERHTTCDPHRLLRPDADGRYAEAIVLEPGHCTLSMLFSDWSRSGHADLRVSNDRHYYRDGAEQLWRVEPGEPPVEYTAGDGWQQLRLWGMGIASRDLTGDGRPEVYLTSQGDNKLQTLADDANGPTFVDMALRVGATAHRPYEGDTTLPSTAWHPEFADVNNDGYVDLFVSKGNVELQEDHALRDPNNLLLGRADGTFVEAAPDAGLVRFASSRGAALADLNADGMLDLVVVNRREPVELWRNVGTGSAGAPEPMGAWLAIVPRQDGGNHDAIGAWVEVREGDRTWTIERTVGGGHVSGQLGPIHVGIGEAERVEVRVTWPDGEVGPWQRADAGRVWLVERGSDPRPLRP